MNQIAAAGTGLSFARWADSATLADTITVLGDQPSMASAVDGRHPTVEPLFPPAPAALTTFVWSIAKWIVVSPEESTPVTTCPARTRGATTAYPADFNHSRVVHVDDSLLRRAAGENTCLSQRSSTIGPSHPPAPGLAYFIKTTHTSRKPYAEITK